MEFLALIGLSAYCGVSLVVGTRLLLLARRTREAPELLIGVAFITGGAIGYVLVAAATLVRASSPELARSLYYVGMPLLSLCAVCLYRFWQQIYHPSSRSAPIVVLASAAVLASALLIQWWTTDAGSNTPENPWYRLQLVAQGGAYAINFVESARLHGTLRRRLAIGLAESIVVNRVLMWAVSSAAVCVQYGYSLSVVFAAAPGERAAANPGVISVLGLIAGGAILLAFFPPAAYRRWISASA